MGFFVYVVIGNQDDLLVKVIYGLFDYVVEIDWCFESLLVQLEWVGVVVEDECVIVDKFDLNYLGKIVD